MIRAWYAFWLWLAYATGFRWRWNALLRRVLDGGAYREPLATLKHPPALAHHLRRWAWRRDGGRIGGLFIPIDYVSHPEVTEGRISSHLHADGDCDDAHHYAAVQLSQMPRVDVAVCVSIGYPGGGHMACVYRYLGEWWLLDYGRITLLADGLDSVEGVLMASRGHAGKRPRWLVYEDIGLQRVTVDQLRAQEV